ncbi:MAG: hypothetical protein ABSB91_00665 [Sedimentisphaerales bacterium]|jgi:hypothetical protein
MNERSYTVLSLVLALAALAISAFPYFIFPIVIAGVILGIHLDKILDKIFSEPIYLYYWGWITGLVLSIISFRISRHLNNQFLKSAVRFIVYVAAILALLMALSESIHLFRHLIKVRYSL